MVTSYDRISALLSGKGGHIGLYENIWPDTLTAWRAQGHIPDCDPTIYFQLDLGRLGAAFDPLPRPHYQRILEDTPEWYICEDGAGAVTRRFKNRSVTPGHIRWDMTDPEIWESRYKPLLLKPDESRIPTEVLQKRMEQYRAAGKWICFNMSFIWEGFRQAVGDVCMYESLLTDPEWVLDYNETMLEMYKHYILSAIERVGKPDGIWFSEDLAYNQGLFCSPRVLEKLYMPYYARLNEFLHALGLKVILHSCGNITAALSLIADAGFDALHPMQVHAGCDPVGIARAYGDRFALIGGMDTHVIETNNISAIRAAQTQLMRGMMDAGARYIFSSDHSISTNVAFDTYRCMLDIFFELAGRS